jgi:hypothetical protein
MELAEPSSETKDPAYKHKTNNETMPLLQKNQNFNYGEQKIYWGRFF